ncbi:MAG: flagellar motor stator protein MotA [Pseudomonadota bacterium]
MNVIVGTIVALLCIAGGYMAHGGKLMALFQPFEVLIIGGAALGAMIISNPKAVTMGVFKSVGPLLKPTPYNKNFYLELLALMFDIFNKIKRQGMIAIESDIDDPHASPIFSKYPSITNDHHVTEFISDYLRIMMLGAMAPHEMENLMDMELETHHAESALVPGAITKVSDGLPGFGIVAAVLGIVNTMGSLGGPPEILGQKVGAALVGTLLGILFAYGFVGPFASLLEHKEREHAKFYECIKVCLMATINGAPPKIAVEFGRKIVYHSMRPTFQELEDRVSKK